MKGNLAKADALIAKGDIDGAEKFILKELAKKKLDHSTLNDAAMFYHVAKHDMPRAMELYKKALEAGKGKADRKTVSLLHYNIGCVHMSMEDCQAAIVEFDKSAELGNEGDAWWNKSIALLNGGYWPHGMAMYKHRRHPGRTSEDTVKFPAIPLPYIDEWDMLDGRRVLVLNEQGLGDEILFSRAYRKASAKAIHMKIQCYSLMERLFRNSMPELDFFTERSFGMELVSQFDSWTGTGELFRMLVNSGKDDMFPCHEVLRPEREVELAEGNKVGVCWSCNPHSKNAKDRSLRLEDLEFIRGMEDAALVALQQGDVEIPSWMVDLRNDLKSFDDTAAYMDKMDMVFTIDTSVAHLAGAMGKPTVLMVNRHLDWRWRYRTENDFSLLYPSIKVVTLDQLKQI